MLYTKYRDPWVDNTLQQVDAPFLNQVEQALADLAAFYGPDDRLTLDQGQGRRLHVAPELDGAGDVSLFELAASTFIPTYINGTNGTRGDSITSDAANAGGHSSWTPLLSYAPSFTEKGSNHLLTVVATNDEGPVADKYNELTLIFGSVIANRRGALTEGYEFGATVNVPARASVGTLQVADNVPRANYATFLGAGSVWGRTGARGLWVRSSGSNPPTGIFLEGGFSPAIYYAPTSAGTTVLLSQLASEANPRLLLTDGTLFLGPGSSALDVVVTRADAAVLGLNGGLQMGEYEPPAGPADTARVYARDNGAGKTQLCVRFATGAVAVLATQP